MCLIAVHDQNGTSDLVTVFEDRLIYERLASDHIPAAVKVERSCVIAAVRLVVVVIIRHEERCVCRERIYHSAAERIFAGFQIFQSLRAHCHFFGVARLFTVLTVKISIRIHSRHIIHCRGHRRLDAGVQRSSIDRHAAPAADSENTDPVGIDFVVQRQEIHSRHEVLGVDVGRCHISHISAALTGERRIKSDGQKASLRHCLRIET